MESSSSFGKEDWKHSLEDSLKLINMMVSTSNIGIVSKQDAKFESILGLGVFGLQLIKNRITLMKTTLDPSGEKWQVLELRSAIVPTSWDDRIHLLKVFELLVCLYIELKDQVELEKILMREQNQVISVSPNESLRHVLRSSHLPSSIL